MDPPLFLPDDRFDVKPDEEPTTTSKPTANETEDTNKDDDAPANDDESEDGITAVNRTESDVEMAHTVNQINEQAKLRNREQKEIDWLQLTSRELQEMVDEEKEYKTNEYFDMQYFSEATGKVWEKRREEDMSPMSPKTIRLFNVESSILKQAERSRASETTVGFLQSSNASNNDRSYALKHPLLHRRLERNQERREVFRKAAEERSAVNALPSLRTATGDKSIVAPERDLFPMSKRNLIGASPNGSADTSAIAASRADHRSPLNNRLSKNSSTPPPTKEDKEETPNTTENQKALVIATNDNDELQTPNRAKEEEEEKNKAPPTLAELLKQQKEQLSQTQKSDDEIYKPILKSFMEYTANVHRKLDELSSMEVRIVAPETGDEVNTSVTDEVTAEDEPHTKA